jgi:heterodisulfide reductase subunit A
MNGSDVSGPILIVGAGPAGLSAAACLGRRGIDSVLVDKDFFPGGHGAQLACQATDTCARCNACLTEDAAGEIDPARVSLAAGTQVVEAATGPDGHRVALRTEAQYLDPDICVDCGACFQACPEVGKAIRQRPLSLGPRYGLDASQCLRFKGQDCDACQKACPVDAINWDAEPSTRELSVPAVILAAGYTPFDAALKPRYGYDLYDDVITSIELDHWLRNGSGLVRPSNGQVPADVAFIQCVGSRDISLGRDYCSRVCCGYAMRLAKLIRYRRPDTAVSMFYMDLQNVGRNFDQFLSDAMAEVEFIHGVPGELHLDEDGRVKTPFLNEGTGHREVRQFDLVVLSVGLGPPDIGPMADLGYQSNEDGFYTGQPDQGLFAAGAAIGPMGVAEAKAGGLAAAEAAARYVRRS